MNILLIEDDVQLNTTVAKFLKSKSFDVTKVFDGEDAIEILDTKSFDLYIIDINIPHINGLTLLTYIRQKNLSSPIIIITADTELDNFKKAFQYGCNEFVKKPFYLEELMIRINNLIDSENNEFITISDSISFDMKKEELTIEKNIIKLRKKERRLLKLLLENVNYTVLTSTIQDYVWENEIKDYYPIRQLINDLRRKFDTGENFIFSEKGIGYKFEIKK